MLTIESLRKSGEFNDQTDEQLATKLHQVYAPDMSFKDFAPMVGMELPKTDAGMEWKAAKENYKAGLWAVGSQILPDEYGGNYAKKAFIDDKAKSDFYSAQSSAPQQFSDVHSAGDF